MTQTVEPNVTETSSDTDLGAAVRRVLESSPEPLTLSKIRVQLPASLRGTDLDDLGEALRRQVAANVLVQYPKYRSQQDRFWDRPMRVHIARLLQTALAEQPLAASELRRKLPDYAKTQAESVLEEEVAQARLFRHPPTNSRGGPRFGAAPPDPKSALRNELAGLFARLEHLGFTQAQLRQSALELLHEEEWAPAPSAGPQQPAAPALPEGSQASAAYTWSAEQQAPASQTAVAPTEPAAANPPRAAEAAPPHNPAS